jgi:hypothetical protein
MATALALASAVAASGCASRLVAVQDASAPAPVNVTASGPGGMQTTLHHLVAPDSAGSWVKEATWLEYAVTLANEGSQALTVYSLELASSLPANPVHSTSLAMLEEESRSNARFYRSLGAGFGWPGAVAGVAAAAAGGFAGAAIAIIALPVVAVGGGTYVLMRRSRDKEDRGLIDAEIARRGVPLPARLEPGARLSGSAFFPLAMEARQLIVRYQHGADVSSLAMDLPGTGP